MDMSAKQYPPLSLRQKKPPPTFCDFVATNSYQQLDDLHAQRGPSDYLILSGFLKCHVKLSGYFQLIIWLINVALDSNCRRDFKVYDWPFRPRLQCPT